MITGDLLAARLRRCAFRLGSESLLQNDVEEWLGLQGIPFKREHTLGPGERVDFLIDTDIVLEIKMKVAPRMILRQLQRYSTYDQVSAIVLLSVGATSMPDSMNGKPVYVANLGAGYL